MPSRGRPKKAKKTGLNPPASPTNPEKGGSAGRGSDPGVQKDPQDTAKEELRRVSEQIERELKASPAPESPAPAPGGAPHPPPAGFQYQISTKGLLRATLNGYARFRQKDFTLSDEKAVLIAAPCDRIATQLLDRYLPGWAKENPELTALVLLVSETIIEIESAPRLAPRSATGSGSPAPATPPGQDRFPSAAEIEQPPNVR